MKYLEIGLGLCVLSVILTFVVFTSAPFQVSQAGDLLIEVYVERKEPDCSIIIRVSPKDGCKEYFWKLPVLICINFYILNSPLFLVFYFTCLVQTMTGLIGLTFYSKILQEFHVLVIWKENILDALGYGQDFLQVLENNLTSNTCFSPSQHLNIRQVNLL